MKCNFNRICFIKKIFKIYDGLKIIALTYKKIYNE